LRRCLFHGVNARFPVFVQQQGSAAARQQTVVITGLVSARKKPGSLDPAAGLDDDETG